ncbi:MAG: recombination protein O N-terminal domain-containing protein [Bacteroidales bacterium]|nr:recombination protein O N-terminal domain-containing protein [Bacteroidales bacterium]
MEKTEAIVLHVSKYGDNKLIVNTFSKNIGRVSFTVVIPLTRNKASALPYCQPLFQNEVEYTGANNTGIFKASRITPAVTYTTIPFSTGKTAVVMFLAEMLSRVLQFSEQNEEMYNYISTSLKLLDSPEYKGKNFHLKFLLQLAKYMGFYPGNRYSEAKPCFDISKSVFVEDQLGVPHLIRPPYSKIFNSILDRDLLHCEDIEMSGMQRSYLLERVIEYYAYRFDNLNNIRSLDVLQTVFH